MGWILISQRTSCRGIEIQKEQLLLYVHQLIHIIILYPHDKARVGNVVVVCAVGVHELDVEGELGQRDVVVDVMMRVVKPLHLDLIVQKIHSN